MLYGAVQEMPLVWTLKSDKSLYPIFGQCPVSSEVSGLTDRGRYQTFTKQAGMVARRSDFPDGVHTIVISLPDDDACILNPSGQLPF